MKALIVAALTIALGGLAGCDRSKSVIPTSPAAPSQPAAPATPTVTGLTVTGTASLAAIGDMTQLAAVARLSDGTTRTVTGEAAWQSTDPSVIAIAPGGLATVIRFGRAYVFAIYQAKSSGLTVEATPTGSFIVFGRVREPGSGGVDGARGVESASGVVVVTDQNGEYSIPGLTMTPHLSFTKDGFEPIAFDATPDEYGDLPMQRVIRLAGGATASLKLAPHDMDYAPVAGGTHCYPCRLIRVAVADSGVLQLRASWAETHSTLNFWVNGRTFDGSAVGPSEVAADVPVTAGEVLVYIGMSRPVEQYVPLTLTTALVR